MYSQYYHDKNLSALVGTGKDYTEELRADFEVKLERLDKFVYLIQLFEILKSNSEDFLLCNVTKKDMFWKINKYLLGYVNAVYSYKEYVTYYSSRKSEFYKIQDKYYLSCGKYRFLCEYRNRIIHQSALIKDTDKNTGDPYIDLLELISYFESLIDDCSKNPKQISKNEKTREYIAHLETYKDKCLQFNGRPYLSAKKIVNEANTEISEMNERLCFNLWNSEIKDIFSWIHNMLVFEDNKYEHTYAVKDRDPDTSVPA